MNYTISNSTKKEQVIDNAALIQTLIIEREKKFEALRMKVRRKSRKNYLKSRILNYLKFWRV